MTITKSMVCDILSQYQITEYIAENAAFSFERAEFLSGDSGSFLGTLQINGHDVYNCTVSILFENGRLSIARKP